MKINKKDFKEKVVITSKNLINNCKRVVDNSFSNILFYIKSKTFKVENEKYIVNGIVYEDYLYVKYNKKDKANKKYYKGMVLLTDNIEYEVVSINYNIDYLLSYKEQYYNLKCAKLKLIKRR